MGVGGFGMALGVIKNVVWVRSVHANSARGGDLETATV